MSRTDLSNGANAPDPAGVAAGPQGGSSGVGGEPKGAALEADARRQTAQPPTERARAPAHGQPSNPPEYRARPAGESGLGAQADHASTIQEPQGDGHYQATDHGPQPLREG
jgi:hypothetical protein